MPLVVLLGITSRHRVGEHYLLLAQVGHPEFLTATLIPQIVVSCVYRKPVQPRFKALFLPELIEREIKPQEDFLCDILYIFRTGDQTGDRPPNPLPVGLDDFVERRGIALLSPRDQTEINQHAAPGRCPASGFSDPASDL